MCRLPVAQRRQCCPHCFRRGLCLRADSCFGGGAAVARQAGSDFGVVNGPRSSLPFTVRGLGNPQFKPSRHNSQVAPCHLGIVSAQFTMGAAPSPFAPVRRCPCSMCLTWPPRSYIHSKNKRSIYSGVHLMGTNLSPFIPMPCRARSTLLLHLAASLLCTRQEKAVQFIAGFT